MEKPLAPGLRRVRYPSSFRSKRTLGREADAASDASGLASMPPRSRLQARLRLHAPGGSGSARPGRITPSPSGEFAIDHFELPAGEADARTRTGDRTAGGRLRCSQHSQRATSNRASSPCIRGSRAGHPARRPARISSKTVKNQVQTVSELMTVSPASPRAHRRVRATVDCALLRVAEARPAESSPSVSWAGFPRTRSPSDTCRAR